MYCKKSDLRMRINNLATEIRLKTELLAELRKEYVTVQFVKRAVEPVEKPAPVVVQSPVPMPMIPMETTPGHHPMAELYKSGFETTTFLHLSPGSATCTK